MLFLTNKYSFLFLQGVKGGQGALAAKGGCWSCEAGYCLLPCSAAEAREGPEPGARAGARRKTISQSQ